MPSPQFSLAAGFRAVQSTPILTDNGSVAGVYSTHYAEAQQWTPELDSALDEISNRMAALLTELDATN